MDVIDYNSVVHALHMAYMKCGDDFRTATTNLAFHLLGISESDLTREVTECVDARLQDDDNHAISCFISLLSAAGHTAVAVTAGKHALDRGCNDEEVIVALGYALQQADRDKGKRPTRASALLAGLNNFQRSANYIEKLASLHRDAGHAFLAEAVLRQSIHNGCQKHIVRLAEHFIEFHDWSSAYNIANTLPIKEASAYTNFLIGRCAVSLLIEADVIRVMDELLTLPPPGPSYAHLLAILWMGRVGDIDTTSIGTPVRSFENPNQLFIVRFFQRVRNLRIFKRLHFATKKEHYSNDSLTLQILSEEHFPPLVARDLNSIRSLPLTVTHQVTILPRISKWREIHNQMPVPSVLGIGAQRTATTWLWWQLLRRPEVQLFAFKEPCFFSDFDSFRLTWPLLNTPPELSMEIQKYWEGPTRNLHRYLALFNKAAPLRIDISPNYCELPDKSVAAICDLLGSHLNIIMSVRDPIERTWSNLKFDMQLSGASIDELSFEQRTQYYISEASGRRNDYITILNRWRSYFNNVKVIFYEDVLTSPETVARDIEKFVGLQPSNVPWAHMQINNTEVANIPPLDRAFLFGLYKNCYVGLESKLGGAALNWRSRQLRLLEQAPFQNHDSKV